ncbi:mitochondrial import inner membrane translocase subunit Tim9 isoform X2 [Tyto alba]|uniref:mitochondrial import inner membrane translocase subunit Tim9 isoform X2 n=1 Tax=Tyto alba TaxID=56313 RepID=UPI0014040576|nr:mitochondrial import inner membrane translocase subunit Tim9 isoform X2 [Tyto alba]
MAGQISESDQIKQFKEFLGTYNKLTENCFLDCIKDFTSREVKPEELSVEVLVPQLLMGGIFMDMEVAHLQRASRSLKLLFCCAKQSCLSFPSRFLVSLVFSASALVEFLLTTGGQNYSG